MLEKAPAEEELRSLIGERRLAVWNGLCAKIDGLYEMERLWNSGGKAWKYEYKYRRGGKTLCALYAREHDFGFMIIFGVRRKKFEAEREAIPRRRTNLRRRNDITATAMGDVRAGGFHPVEVSCGFWRSRKAE
jgi:hypothetical protein